jgi:hypothetical protein
MVLAFGVASTPRTMVSGGIGWIRSGIGRRLNSSISNLSGKPTFLSVLLNDGWVAAYDPRHTLKAIKTLDSVISKTQPLVIQIWAS